MEKFKAFLGFDNPALPLQAVQQSSFTGGFDLISWLAMLIVALWSLRWLPPFKNIIASIRHDIYSESSNSDFVRQLVPNFQHRCHYYRMILWGIVLTMLGSYALAFCYGSYAIAALLSEHLGENRLTAFFILSALSAGMYLLAYYFMKEANRLAVFLQRVIF